MSETALLRIPEVARFLNVSVRKAWAMRDAGELPGVVFIGKCVRVSRAALAQWVADGCPDIRSRRCVR